MLHGEQAGIEPITELKEPMSDTKKDGGPAFPVMTTRWDNGNTGEINFSHEGGMTLRDYFAGKAMNGMATACGWEGGPFEKIASDAYKIADAMLKAREQS